MSHDLETSGHQFMIALDTTASSFPMDELAG